MEENERRIVEFFLAHVVPHELAARWRSSVAKTFFNDPAARVMILQFGHDTPRVREAEVVQALSNGEEGLLEGVVMTHRRALIVTHEGEWYGCDLPRSSNLTSAF